jgi:hypothetical protein
VRKNKSWYGIGRCGSRYCRRRTATRRTPRITVAGEVPLVFLRRRSCRKGDGAGEEERESEGRDLERRVLVVLASVRTRERERRGEEE